MRALQSQNVQRLLDNADCRPFAAVVLGRLRHTDDAERVVAGEAVEVAAEVDGVAEGGVDDLAVELFRGVEVVVVIVEPGRLQLAATLAQLRLYI